MSEPYQEILFDKSSDNVATVTINRPRAMNSFNIKMCDEFRHVWQRIAADEDIHAVVLRASEGRAFSTGFDVRSGENILGTEQLWNQRDPGESLGPKENLCWKPVVCAVHGMCAGGALYWVNESDIVICSPDAEFFDPHVTYGRTAALEPIGLRWKIPLEEVLRMALLGNDERIGAETALRISLVSEIVEPKQLWERAHELAAIIAAKPSIATQGTVRAIWESLDATRSAALNTGLKYCQVGNEQGKLEVDVEAVMAKAKTYTVR